MSENRTIWIIAEGKTERAAKDHLKKFMDERAAVQGEQSRVRLREVPQDGGLKAAKVRALAKVAVEDPTIVGIVALTDVYPAFHSAEEARRTVQSWLPDDPRCQAHVAAHDFEAWLLVGWEALTAQAGVGALRPWGAHPEQVNGGHPPAHRISALFQQGKPPRKYVKPIDGKKLFEKLDLAAVASRCPQFRAFLNGLLGLAGLHQLGS